MSAKNQNSTEQNQSDLFLLMRDLYEKLICLDYAKEFVPNYKCPPIHRYYFCQPINQAQQFFAFCCLSSYLINKLNGQNKNSLTIDSYDDPNLTIEKILKAARHHVDVSNFANLQHKLKQGYGLEVINLLNSLVDKLLNETFTDNMDNEIKIVIRNADGDEQDENENEDDIENNEDNEIELEEEFEDYLDDESDLVVHDDEWQDTSANDDNDQQEREMIESDIDVTEFKLELERVLPKINASFMNNYGYGKDRIGENEWRIHLQAAQKYHGNIETIFNQTNGMLTNMIADIRTNMDKIRSKENYLQQNSNTILAEWINVRQKALSLQEQVNQGENELEEKSLQLQRLNEEDKQTKQSIEEFSLKITDSSPLAEAKKAREMLRQELTRVNLQIGVAVQTLVRHVYLHSTYS